MPYKNCMKLMIGSLVQYMVTLINMLPSKCGISSDLRPAAIILGYPNTDYNQLKITFRAYSQVYIGTTNSNKQITAGVISLCPENERGEHYFMPLATGKHLHTYIWIELPIS